MFVAVQTEKYYNDSNVLASMKTLIYKIAPTFFTIITLYYAYSYLELEMNTSYAKVEATTWDTFANCEPHVTIDGPESFKVRFAPGANTRVGVPEITGFLSAPGIETQEAKFHNWDAPQKGWHSLVFIGPTVKANYYCDISSPTKKLQLSYNRVKNLHVSVSDQAHVSSHELPTIQTQIKKYGGVTVKPENNNPYTFQAGTDTKTPYWLTFSVPIHSPHNVSTKIRYEFE
jgi:hypothetical protein